jgi:hypothetical protein
MSFGFPILTYRPEALRRDRRLWFQDHETEGVKVRLLNGETS